MKKNILKENLKEGKEVNMMIRNSLRVCVLLVLAMLMVASNVSAVEIQPIYMSNIMDGDDLPGICGKNCFQIGDKKFTDFSLSGGGITPDLVTVAGLIFDNGNKIVIRFGGPFGSNSGKVDYQLFYAVEAIGLISSIDQAIVAGWDGAGGTITLAEFVRSTPDPFSEPVARSTISFNDVVDPPGEPLSGDQLIINPPLHKVWVEKDLRFVANEGGAIDATIIYQSFDQTVPEPGTLLLLGSGLAGLAFFGRLRRK
jgi:hypothetical protein